MPLVPHAFPRARRRTRTLSRLVAAATALLGSAPLVAQQPYDIALRDGLLSIRANGAAIMDLAEALAAETGVSFVVTGDTGTPITTEIVDEPFARAVAKLSPNHLLVKDGKSADAAVVEVVLMLDDADGGGGGNDGFLPSGAPADEIIGGEEMQPMEDPGFDQTQEVERMQDVGQADEQLQGQQYYAPDGSLQDGTELPDDGIDPESDQPPAQ